MTQRALVLIAAFPLAACVPAGDFPSLAMRPGERDLTTEEPARPEIEVPDDAALRRRLADLMGQAAAGESAFDSAYAPAAAAVAAAGARETDSWVEAQLALSRLEAEREPMMRALADLDRIAMERIDVPTSMADWTAINAAIAAVEQVAVVQQQLVDALRARLSPS